MNWYETRTPPLEPGAYLVTTAHGAIRIDRWDGEHWGACSKTKGRYKMHLAWCHLPKPYKKFGNL